MFSYLFPIIVIDCNLAAIDLVFVLDASTSVGNNFPSVLDLVRNTVTALEIGPAEGQVAVIRFSSDASVVIRLTDNSNEAALLAAINGISTTTEGSTNTAAALNSLLSDGFMGARPPSQGVPRFAVVVTDGRSNNAAATAAAAAALRAAVPQITVFAIGIMPAPGFLPLNEAELELIASEPSFVRTIAGFNAAELDAVTQVLRLQACQGIL